MADKTPATDTVETKAAKSANVQVNGTIPGKLYDALNEYRWTARIDRFPKLVTKALEEYAVNHGLMTPEGEVIPQESGK